MRIGGDGLRGKCAHGGLKLGGWGLPPSFHFPLAPNGGIGGQNDCPLLPRLSSGVVFHQGAIIPLFFFLFFPVVAGLRPKTGAGLPRGARQQALHARAAGGLASAPVGVRRAA